MKVVRNVSVRDKCLDCNVKSKGFFCQPVGGDLEIFGSMLIPKTYPKGSILFFEGESAAGVYMLCEGKVKLSACSQYGKIIVLEITEPGDILGLSAAVSGVEHETTAEAVETSRVNYIETSDLLRFLRGHPEASLNAARQLSRNYQTAYRQVRSLGLSDSVADKLGKLFLDWSGNGSGGDGRVQMKNAFTHAEMGEMVGASRETVTRALKYFRERDLITIKGSDLVIHDRQRLKAAIG